MLTGKAFNSHHKGAFHVGPNGNMASAQRIDGLDTARAVAIALAMTSHCFIHFSVWETLPNDASVAVRAITRSATPTFIVLFGMMLELVYVPRMRDAGTKRWRRRIYARALECYIWYIAVIIAGIIGGKLSITQAIKASIFLDDAYFANILKFYTIALAASWPILLLRVRLGLIPILALLGIVFAIWPAFYVAEVSAPDFEKLLSFLFGIGSAGGPAILQGMIFVVFGMLLGRCLDDWRNPNVQKRKTALTLAAILFVVLATFSLLVWLEGLVNAYEGFAGLYRRKNHPYYYIIGCAHALLVVWLGLEVAKHSAASRRAVLNVFGVSSLFAYGSGNVFLNLLPKINLGWFAGIILTATFIALLYCLTRFARQMTPSTR